MSQCKVCPDGYISEESGETSCDKCEQGTEPNSQHTVCGRIPPLYSFDYVLAGWCSGNTTSSHAADVHSDWIPVRAFV